eukprot:134503-Chlamydomonas_euryale.AAC.3
MLAESRGGEREGSRSAVDPVSLLVQVWGECGVWQECGLWLGCGPWAWPGRVWQGCVLSVV